MNSPVVVGVDGSPTSYAAAGYAARIADQRGRPLHLVHGYLHPLGYGVGINPYDLGVPAPTRAAVEMLESAAEQLRSRWPGLEVETRQGAGGPAASLIDESRRAGLLVVGTRGVGGFKGLLLGSVSTQVAGHSRCPVFVVRPAEGEELPYDGPVLVGVDGSTHSRLAVAHGAQEAMHRGGVLRLVNAYAINTSPMLSFPPEGLQEYEVALRDNATGVLREAAAVVRHDHPELTIEEHVVAGANPAQDLVEATRGAALAVVGSRGHGGFVGMLLGSISQALVQHAHCPVLVAHGTLPDQE